MGTTTFTSLGATFAAGDVGKGINVAGAIYRVVSRTSNSIIDVDRNLPTASGQTWKLGGCLLTIGKLLQTTAAIMQNGDTLWIGAGTYREVITPTMTSLTAMGYIRGDVDGVQTGDSGDVIWTAYTTNDKTAPSGSALLALNGKSFLTFRDITMVGGTANPSLLAAATTGSHDITFYRCLLTGVGASGLMAHTATADVASNFTFDSCVIVGNSNPTVTWTLPRSGTSDYDVGILWKNCLLVNPSFTITLSGAANNVGGIDFFNCTIISKTGNLFTTPANFSTTYPVSVYNCVLHGAGSTCFNANTSGQIVEDYNIIAGFSVARTNTSTGANSATANAYWPGVEMAQALITGRRTRLFGMPTTSSPILNFGAQAGGPTVDILGVTRPAGGAGASYALGAIERGNTWAKETSTVRTGSNALSITGPGYQDFDIPVDAASTTVSVYMRYDSTYAGTKPQIQVLNGTECGVSDATSSAVTTVNTWEQLSLNFTPTAKGIVTVRLLSSDTNGGGKAFADDFAVA